MSKVITLSQKFPSYHARKNEPTYFVEQVLNALDSIGIHMTFQHLVDLNQSSIDEGKLSEPQLWTFWCTVVDGIHNQKISGQKLHTIRAKTVNKKTGAVTSRWKQGDKASLRVWSGKPYRTPQIIIAPDVELMQVGDFRIDLDLDRNPWIDVGTQYFCPPPLDIERSIIADVAKNDGLTTQDLLDWFEYPEPFEGQILAWKEVHYV